jgi:hypothetical protein
MYIRIGTAEKGGLAHPVAAVFGGDLRHGAIGQPTAPDADWHLAIWGGFDRNMVGAYWFDIPESWARYKWPGLWEVYQLVLESGQPLGQELFFPSRWESGWGKKEAQAAVLEAAQFACSPEGRKPGSGAMGELKAAVKAYNEAEASQWIAASITAVCFDGDDGADKAHSPNPELHHGRNRVVQRPQGDPPWGEDTPLNRRDWMRRNGWSYRWEEERGTSGPDSCGRVHTWRRDMIIVVAPRGNEYRF